MERAQAIPGFADAYERILVPGIFGPWSDELLERARPIGVSDRILDLGCGTGIVARRVRARLGGGARVTGVDVDAGMLAKARDLAPEIRWIEGDAMELPFPDASFELVLCQQVLQFVPDRAKALREIRRVLAPGGRLLVATWRARHEQKLFEALGRIAEAHLGVPNEKRFLLGDEAALRAMVEEAGFQVDRLEVVARVDRLRGFPLRQSALAANFDLSTLSDAEREAKLDDVERESREAVKEFLEADDVIASPTTANLVVAKVPS
jgi:ubiquinone/menaquinone biosynthesis C-methylase UbiE